MMKDLIIGVVTFLILSGGATSMFQEYLLSSGYFSKTEQEKVEKFQEYVDENKIISNIITVGIIDLYNQEGIEGVNNYIEKSNKVNSNSNTCVSTNETLNTDSQAENATQKIMNDDFYWR